MNPVFGSWRALPLWAKIITIPFLISGLVVCGYILAIAVLGIVASIARTVEFLADLPRKSKNALRAA